MTDVEKALTRALVAETDAEREAAKQDLLALLSSEPASPARPMLETETIIRRILLELGVPGHILGHDYLVTAISLAVSDLGIMKMMSKRLYPEVGAAHGTTASRAERAIRHGVELSFNRCDPDVLSKYFGWTISPSKGKPTNGEFIARVSAVVRERMEGVA